MAKSKRGNLESLHNPLQTPPPKPSAATTAAAGTSPHPMPPNSPEAVQPFLELLDQFEREANLTVTE